MPAFDNIRVPKVTFDAKAAKAALVGAGAGLAVASEAAQGCAKYALDMMKVRRRARAREREREREDSYPQPVYHRTTLCVCSVA